MHNDFMLGSTPCDKPCACVPTACGRVRIRAVYQQYVAAVLALHTPHRAMSLDTVYIVNPDL